MPCAGSGWPDVAEHARLRPQGDRRRQPRATGSARRCWARTRDRRDNAAAGRAPRLVRRARRRARRASPSPRRCAPRRRDIEALRGAGLELRPAVGRRAGRVARGRRRLGIERAEGGATPADKLAASPPAASRTARRHGRRRPQRCPGDGARRRLLRARRRLGADARQGRLRRAVGLARRHRLGPHAGAPGDPGRAAEPRLGDRLQRDLRAARPGRLVPAMGGRARHGGELALRRAESVCASTARLPDLARPGDE